MSTWDKLEAQRTDRVLVLDDATRRRATLAVCHIAGNAADARTVLEALGLIEVVGAP